jgi:hypothetical protein
MVALGKINITAGGTPQQVTTNPTYKGKVVFQADPANTHVVYVGLKNMVVSTGVQVLGIVGIPPATGAPPSLTIEIPLAPGGISADQLWIDGTTSEDVYVSIY